ncbi:MAG: hypothetical protein LBI18_08060 [Planctomycetaceae bacterium]|jgi:prefoldin subunit 5|nr:hypothetical protein [Planctomycetaceae bacterium]
MQYAIYTRGINKDYLWNKPHNNSTIHDLLSSHGIVVKRQTDGDFTVYLTSEKTTKKDYIGRNITISCLISDCSDWIAKGLTIYALQNWDHFVQDMEKFVNNFGSDDWSIDEDAIKRFVSKHSANTTGNYWITKIENDNTTETRNELLENLTKYDFSENTGIKCVIDNGVLTGNDCLTKIRTETDVYLWTGGNKKILTDQKTIEKNITNNESTRIITKPKLSFLKKFFQFNRETIWQIILFTLLTASILCNIYLVKSRNNAQKNYETKIAELKKQNQLYYNSILQRQKHINSLQQQQRQLEFIPNVIDKNFNNSNREIKNLKEQINILFLQIQKIQDEIQKLSQPPEQNNNPKKESIMISNQ